MRSLHATAWLPAAFALLLAAPAAAQEPSVDLESIRQMLINGFEQSKQMDLDFSEAMPESALRYAPTDGVRDFAQQIIHISDGNMGTVGTAVVDAPAPSVGDTAVYLNDVKELQAALTRAYDWVIGTLRDIPAQELGAETELFGIELTKWRVYMFALTHAYWTRGQLIPYLRLNGVEPPRYRPF